MLRFATYISDHIVQLTAMFSTYYECTRMSKWIQSLDMICESARKMSTRHCVIVGLDS